MRLSPCPLTLKQLQIGLLRLSVRWRQWLQSQASCTLGGHCITPCLRHMCSYWEFHTSRLPIYGSTAQYLAWLSSHLLDITVVVVRHVSAVDEHSFSSAS
ncbi:sucrose transport protein SUC8 [Trifolium repens]|nr:sucrose transport protein SUC8 [Trifolium repens]